MTRRLYGQVLAQLAGVALLSAALFGALAFAIMGKLYGDATAENMERAASALVAAIPSGAMPAFTAGGKDATRSLGAWTAALAAESGWRVTVVRADGLVLADSSADPARMENHGLRPEVAAALSGKAFSDRRRSSTLGRELFYAAVPVRSAAGDGGAPTGVLRVAAELPAIESRLVPYRWAIVFAAALVAAIASASAALFSRRVTRPLRELAAVARGIAMGDRSRPIPLTGGPEEVRDLARGLSTMSGELARRVREAETEGRERAAILDGMAEAVLSLDRDCVVRIANPAARSLFAIGQDAELGKPLLELGRSAELEAAARECLEGGRNLETELAIYTGEGGERWFQAFVAPLAATASGAAAASGAVIVLNDITRLRRLERVRSDFVANVSHELRTPIQLIKGFTEALADGAVEDPVRARRFLDIMAGNASRMESLIEDLLTLARLEQEGTHWLKCEVHGLASLLDEAVEAVLPKAESRDISIVEACAEGLEARLNAGLFVQAVVNLLDNAVKYSPPRSKVEVRATALGSEVLVTVADHGIGIPARDLPRIFERFYRVDKARSKELGGTGLGLAIVRHIALAHGGEVAVESLAGEGTRFSIRLPMAGPERGEGQGQSSAS